MSTGRVEAPEPLTEHHEVAGFTCGEPSLDDWLHRRALKNQAEGASRVYVVTDGTSRVIAYYALAAGSVSRAEAVDRVGRNMPDPIPAVVLGRLAVDQAHAGRGLGRALVRDAILRTVQAAESIGVRAMLVHALNDRARGFYLGLDFSPSPLSDLTLMMTLDHARSAVVAASAPRP
jgi:GNAT superfamily N-acetyltransferase